MRAWIVLYVVLAVAIYKVTSEVGEDICTLNEHEELSTEPPLLPPPQHRIDFVDALAALYANHDIAAAIAYLQRSAARGEPRAHWMLAVLYAHGIGVPQSEAKAVLHHTLAAAGSVPESHAALSYRYHHGIGVSKNCEKAAEHARAVANAVAASYHEDIVPRGDPIKLNSASYARSAKRHRGIGLISLLGAQSTETPTAQHHQRQLPNDELVQYHIYKAESGSVQSSMFMAYAYMLGTHGVKQNGHRAIEYLELALSANVAAAHGVLGQIYMQGMPQADPPIMPDVNRASEEFTKGARRSDPASLNGMGVLHATGAQVSQDFDEAAMYFKRASDAGNIEAAYNLALLYLKGSSGALKQNVQEALQLLFRAEKGGSPLAAWQLGNLRHRGVAGKLSASCSEAIHHYRSLIDRGSWSRLLRSASDAYERGDYFVSFMDYAMAAEIGLPSARWNMVYLLEEELVELRNPTDEGHAHTIRLMRLAKSSTDQYYRMEAHQARQAATLVLLERSATLDNDVDAHVKVGDAYYYGTGCVADTRRAINHYRVAASGGNSQAKFNLGLLHQFRESNEHSNEVEQHFDDLHLAKRYYDSAASVNPHAFVATRLALISLNAQWWLMHFGGADRHNGEWCWGDLLQSVASGGASMVTSLVPFTVPTWALSVLARWDDVALGVCVFALIGLHVLRNFIVHR